MAQPAQQPDLAEFMRQHSTRYDRQTDTYTQYGIPRSLAPFFQEYNLEEIDPQQAAATVIERTLRYGGRAELRWLFMRYPEAVIADWVRRWGRYGLPAPHLAFWQLLLGLEDDA